MNTEVGFEMQGGGGQELQHVAAHMQPRNKNFRISTNVTGFGYNCKSVLNPSIIHQPLFAGYYNGFVDSYGNIYRPTFIGCDGEDLLKAEIQFPFQQVRNPYQKFLLYFNFNFLFCTYMQGDHKQQIIKKRIVISRYTHSSMQLHSPQVGIRFL